jgi:flagellar basal-body rod protein FlgC
MSFLGSGVVAGNDFDILGYAASGMEAQRGALDVAAKNIALAQTADPNHPVKAFAPVFTADPDAMSNNPFESMVQSAGSDDFGDSDSVGEDDFGASDAASMSMGGSQGIVAMTGVKQTNIDDNAITQMVDMMNAQRAYESNASVFDVGKSVMTKTLALGQ